MEYTSRVYIGFGVWGFHWACSAIEVHGLGFGCSVVCHTIPASSRYYIYPIFDPETLLKLSRPLQHHITPALFLVSHLWLLGQVAHATSRAIAVDPQTDVLRVP